MSALQQLAARGDAQSLATLRTISQGGTTHGTEVPGWNGDINWNSQDSSGSQGGRASERAAAGALLSGNQDRFNTLSQTATQSHKDWDGGTLAELAPAAAGLLLPGIGGIAAGAAMGGLEAGTGVTNHSVVGGAVRGGLAAGAAHAAQDIIGGGSGVPGDGSSVMPGGGPGATIATGEEDAAPAMAAAGPNLGSTIMSLPSAIGRFATKNPQLALGMAGTAAGMYGAEQRGQAQDAELALQQAAAKKALTPRVPFATWESSRTGH
jgi:hypothetical protein